MGEQRFHKSEVVSSILTPGTEPLTARLHCITMKPVKDYKLVWDDWNKEHLKKHKVSVREVKQAFKAKEIVQESYKGRLIVIGRTKKSRILTIVLSLEKQKNAYVVSARDSNKKERKIYNEKNKTD